MGLDTTHDAWHGPYSSFNQFRRELAKVIGVDLDNMAGYKGDIPFSSIDDDLAILLDHSDCDGSISAEDCGKLAARLDQLISKMEPTDQPWSTYQKAIQFSKGCKLAHLKNEPLEFR